MSTGSLSEFDQRVDELLAGGADIPHPPLEARIATAIGILNSFIGQLESIRQQYRIVSALEDKPGLAQLKAEAGKVIKAIDVARANLKELEAMRQSHAKE